MKGLCYLRQYFVVSAALPLKVILRFFGSYRFKDSVENTKERNVLIGESALNQLILYVLSFLSGKFII